MTAPSIVGLCPHCGTELTDSRVLIEYERTDGEPAAYAECRPCDDVVRPRLRATARRANGRP